MNNKTKLWSAVLVLGLIITGLTIHKNYFFLYLLLTNSQKYPTGEPIDNLVIYKIDPETILASLEQGKTDVFMPAVANPIYDDVPPLESGSFAWEQGDSLKVADAMHQFIWNSSLNDWHLYSASFLIPQCKDISRISSAGFQFYQQQKDWYFIVHSMSIDLEYGYVYAGDNNGHYTGQWEEVDLDRLAIPTAEKALLIAEQNGGQEARLTVKDDEKCSVSISISPHMLFDRSWSNWGWEITYWKDGGTSLIYGVIVNPYTGEFKILDANQ